MEATPGIRIAGKIGWFFARHSLATAAIVLALCALWTVAYLALLLWAMIAGGGIGSPVVYPIGLLLAMAGGTAAAIMLFLPCTVLAEWIAMHKRLPVLFQIPISTALLAVFCAGVIGVEMAAGFPVTFGGVIISFGGLFFTLLLPLGLYWWTAQSGPLLIALFEHLLRKIHAPVNPQTLRPHQ